MIARDWREQPAASITPLYAAEVGRWRDTLAWDTASTWRAVEAGRLAGHACGVVALDDTGTTRGWCFGALRTGTLHIGGFMAADAPATAALLAGLAALPEAQHASRWLWFGWFAAPDLSAALIDAGATVSDYVYMQCRRPGASATASVPALADGAVRRWRAADAASLPAVLASAYAAADVTRPFASSGLLADWYEYAGSLLTTDGCGTFDPELSVVAQDAHGGVTGMAVVTRLSDGTAHLAQLAVRPEAHGRGLGTALLQVAQSRAWTAGLDAITLLVSRHNTAAAALYDKAGFTGVATFLSARQSLSAPSPAAVAAQPRTLRNEACATGGASTRR